MAHPTLLGAALVALVGCGGSGESANEDGGAYAGTDSATASGGGGSTAGTGAALTADLNSGSGTGSTTSAATETSVDAATGSGALPGEDPASGSSGGTGSDVGSGSAPNTTSAAGTGSLGAGAVPGAGASSGTGASPDAGASSGTSSSSGTDSTSGTGSAAGVGSDPGTGSTSSPSATIEIDDTCYPVCTGTATEGDWGWEDEESCVMPDTPTYDRGDPCDDGGTDPGTGAAGAGGAAGTDTGGDLGTDLGGTGGDPGDPGTNTGGDPGTDTGGTGGDPGDPGTNTGGDPGADTGGTGGDPGADTGGAGGDPGTDTGGTGGDPGDPGTSPCGVEPVNPNATEPVRKLLCYLYEVYGSNVLSGQQETSWNWGNPGPEDDVNRINQLVGDYPAVLGGDFLYPGDAGNNAQGTTDRAIAYWQVGGITMIRYHMGVPPTADSYESSKQRGNIDQVLTQGTQEHTSFMGKLDFAAAELQKLEDSGVAVLWAPFHEADPNGWFWWSMEGGAKFVRLWQFMFDYYVNTKGLDNLIWLMPFSGTPDAAFYPGEDSLDIAGPDTYETGQPFSNLYQRSAQIVGSTIPIPLHETGRMPDPGAMFQGSAAPWVLFNTWCDHWDDPQFNTTDHVRMVYAHERTITRGELPSFD